MAEKVVRAPASKTDKQSNEQTDYEKEFLFQFTKMLKTGVKIKKYRKTFGYNYRVFGLNLLNDTIFWNSKKKRENNKMLIKNIVNVTIENIFVNITYTEENNKDKTKTIKLDLEETNSAEMFKDGILLLKESVLKKEKDSSQKKNILKKILVELESEDESETESESYSKNKTRNTKEHKSILPTKLITNKKTPNTVKIDEVQIKMEVNDDNSSISSNSSVKVNIE